MDEPNERGSHSEKGLLESNGGNVRLLLQGTTYRQAPYWTQLEVTQEYPLDRLLSDLGAKKRYDNRIIHFRKFNK